MNLPSPLKIARAYRPERLRLVAFGFALLALGACRDLPTSPGGIDRVQAAAVLPAVVDARLRLTNSFNVTTRQTLIIGLSDIETALRQGDGASVRNYVDSVSRVLDGYKKQPFSSVSADVSAILLALNAVSVVVNTSPSVQP
jgi:hypothetical protein